MRGKMVFLNGPSSAGKTTLAKAFQELMEEPFLYTGTDHFTLMLPDKCWGKGEGFSLVVSETGVLSEIKTGAAVRHLIAGMVRAVGTLVENGHHVIVETGFWGEELQTCINGWARLNPLFVGVSSSLAVLEKREKERGDRLIGLARLQASLIPRHDIYDMEVDTSCRSAAECAETIKRRLENGPAPDALQRFAAFLRNL